LEYQRLTQIYFRELNKATDVTLFCEIRERVLDQLTLKEDLLHCTIKREKNLREGKSSEVLKIFITHTENYAA
jgi:hypothetical protein